MGALHRGHLSLIEKAKIHSDIVIVSIFVNPLQFGPTEDFQQYPRQLQQDQEICQQAGVDVIFAPPVTELYGAGQEQTTVLPPASFTIGLCGQSRPGHFTGVATIVTKLLCLIQPHQAYFGEKDAQQLAIIRQLVRDLNLSVAIIGCPIVREASGLALSSRNQYLTESQKTQALVLNRSLGKAQQLFHQQIRDRQSLLLAIEAEFTLAPEVELEYVDLVDPNTLKPLEKVNEAGLLAIAARVGSTRLIDNVILTDRKPIIAIDGPAGAGKSTVARQVATRLGLLYLDTGAMYRALTWLVIESGIALDDEPAIAELASRAEIRLSTSESACAEDANPLTRVWINQQEVTQIIRSLEVTAAVSAIAAQPFVREELVKQQQQWGRQGGLVAEGRDIGTHVFPQADLKVFLTASVQERAHRRQQDLQLQAQPLISLAELEKAIQDRDRRDSTRAIAPLQKASDAIEIQTDGLTIKQVTEQIVQLYQQKLH